MIIWRSEITLLKLYLCGNQTRSFTKRCLAKHVYCYKYFPEAVGIFRSKLFFKIGVQKNRKFYWETSVLESLFNKVVSLKAVTQVFPVKFLEILKNKFFIEQLRWLLLIVQYNDKHFCKHNFPRKYGRL